MVLTRPVACQRAPNEIRARAANVVFGVHHVEGAHSGVAGSVPFVHSWRLADGKATHFDGRHDTSEVRRIVEPAPAATDPRVDILQLGFGFWASKALLTAVELGVFTELAAKPRDAEALRSALGLHGRGLRDFLDALVSLRLLERDADVYRTTPATGQLLDPTKPDDCIGGTLELATRRFYPCWENLTEALRTGLPRAGDNAFRRRPFEGRSRPFIALDPPEHTRMRSLVNKARDLSGVVVGGIDPDFRHTPEQLRERKAAFDHFDDYFRALLARRREHPTGDLLSELAAVRDRGDRLSEGELLSTCVMLYVVGHRTTTDLIGNGTLALLRNAPEFRRLGADPEVAASAVEELLRYDTPTQLSSRTAMADVELDGHRIERGGQVVLLRGAANRDPEVFPDPDRLDLLRADNRHLSFDGGIHYCLGTALARMEGRIALSALARRVPGLALVTDDPPYRSGPGDPRARGAARPGSSLTPSPESGARVRRGAVHW